MTVKVNEMMCFIAWSGANALPLSYRGTAQPPNGTDRVVETPGTPGF